MQRYFFEQAFTYEEAEKKARDKYGERLTILLHETVKIPGGFLNLFPRDGVRITGIIPRNDRGIQIRDSQRPANINEQVFPRANSLNRESGTPKATLDFNQEKEKFLAMANANANAARENTIKEVLSEVLSIKERLENQGLAGSREEHPTLNRIDDLLILNDFSPSYRKTILEKAKREFSLEGLNNYNAVQDKILEWIGESISIYKDEKLKIRPRIMILVGPTGVGKTTTVVKLAANFGVDYKEGQHKHRVALITIDCYRIGAKQQLETYSNIMGYPCYAVGDYDELKKTIDLNTESCDLIVVDTIGKNPRDMVQLGEMKLLLDACGSLTEVHLVIAAATKSSDIKDILRHFESFNYRSVIVTKLDETTRSGNIIGALSEASKPVSYITNGQKVPTDIRKASVVQFLVNLEGFKVNRTKLEEKFPDRGLDQMQQWR